MKKEYNFSKAERGKFYRKDSKLNIPVYLNKEVLSFIEELADKQKTDISTVVNELLKGDMVLAEIIS